MAKMQIKKLKEKNLGLQRKIHGDELNFGLELKN
jgi:hypothetical protein